MNYFVGASAVELGEMLPRWREPDVRVVIITGAIPGKYIHPLQRRGAGRRWPRIARA